MEARRPPNIPHGDLRSCFHASVDTPRGFLGEFPGKDFGRLCHAGKADLRFEPNIIPGHKLQGSDANAQPRRGCGVNCKQQRRPALDGAFLGVAVI